MSTHTVDNLLSTLDTGTHVIEASAGTGKTWTITSLIAAALALGTVVPSRILAVTFTRAATAELRVRVRERIASLAAELANPATDEPFAMSVLERAGGEQQRDALCTRLNQALAEADSIGVDTIHGWCATLLGQYGDLLGVDAPTDDVSTSLPPLDELTERGALYASSRVTDIEWLGLTSRVASPEGLKHVAAAVLAGVARVRVITADGNVLEEEALGSKLAEVSARVITLYERLQKNWANHGADYDAALQQAISAKQLDGRSWRTGDLQGRYDAVSTLLSNVTELLGANDTALGKFFRFGTRDLASKTRSNNAPFTLGEFSDDIDALRDLLPDFNSALAVPLRHFVNAVEESLPTSATDFDDLLRLVADGLLRDESVAERVRRSADLVLIDESQDTDPLQWQIFSTLYHGAALGKSLVLVGDPKQSIYRFRNAEVAVYLAARAAAAARTHSLDTNFRSDPALVQAVNTIYAAAPGVFGADVQFEPVKPRRSSAEMVPETSTPFRFVHVKVPDDAGGVEQIRKAVARNVAIDIANTLNAPSAGSRMLMRSGETPRKIAPKDCAVLVSINRQAQQIVAELRKVGVHAVAARRTAVTQSAAAREMHALLRAMESPGVTALVRAASLTSLIRPALNLDTTSSPSAILDALDGDAGRRLDEALHAAKLKWDARGVMDAWLSLDRELELSRHIALSDESERRLTDVRHLLEMLASHESRTRSAPAESIRWLAQRMQERETDAIMAEELEERLESDEDAVRVLTTHASKGLEFPLVWVPFAWVKRSPRKRGINAPLVRRYDESISAVEGAVPIGDNKSHPVVAAEHAAEKLEHQRLLYVALTRARNMCTVYVCEDANAKDSPLSALLGGIHDAQWAHAVRLAADPSNGIRTEMMDADEAQRQPAYATPDHVAEISAKPWTRAYSLDTRWRRGSFTALTSRRSAVNAGGVESFSSDNDLSMLDDEPAADEDIETSLPFATDLRSESETVSAQRIALADLPRGRAAGNALHEVLEKVIVQGAPIGASGLVASDALTRQGLDAHSFSAPLAAAVESALDIPLHKLSTTSPALRQLAAGVRFTELGFDFSVASHGPNSDFSVVSPRGLAKVFSAHPGGSVPPSYAQRLIDLDFTPLRGLLNGAIDLVARHDNRWIILDYKSNHLGDHLSDYAAPQLTHAMEEHHYILQYHLYLVALHRFLKMREPEYSYDRHVLGIAYLFVRGMHPEHPELGVFVDHPPASRIEALDVLFRGGD